uniref:Secreted protein n=1 Tax=Steinernema glaseri TaxID=37863 RepID=A0A1I7Z7T3_9BILA
MICAYYECPLIASSRSSKLVCEDARQLLSALCKRRDVTGACLSLFTPTNYSPPCDNGSAQLSQQKICMLFFARLIRAWSAAIIVSRPSARALHRLLLPFAATGGWLRSNSVLCACDDCCPSFERFCNFEA